VKALPASYFDSSVLVKIYVRENGSATAQRLVRTRQVITSSIAGLELMSAFRRNLTARSIDERLHSAIVKRFQQHREKWRYVELTPASLQNAEKYVSDFDVRALDAIHIASAMISRGRFPKDLSFITADSRQRDVAVELGLDVIWVER
jgi:predicted nucleic acid-binding protein